MPTYSDWLDSTRTLYTTAMTNAYANRNNADTTNVWYRGWQAMTATSDLASIVAPNTAFYGGTPDGDEADILLFQGWLQANPVAAGLLNLEPTLAFRGDQRSSLGDAGKVGAEQRRWKGNPLYTFANGVLVGKNGQIAAAIGTEGGEDLEGFGTDTITYFDGIPFSTGTGVPGTTVFRGDTVVSGSIKGTGGVVIIEDVIQLETGVSAPAGIGVDSAGKIRLRHRGEGFKDLVEEIETVQTNLDNSTNTATNLAKLWQGTQNTSSARWGQTLIPNGNMSLKTVDPGDSYSDRLVGVRSIGTTSNIVSIPSDGVGRFDASTGGIVFQAVPVESERYAIRIRYRGGTDELVDDNASDEGLFISFHETSDTPQDMGDKTFVYDTTSTPGAQYEGSGDPATSDLYVTNTSITFPANSTSTDSGGNTDGVTIQTTYQVKSFVYEPSASAKSASLVLYARNYTDNIDIDYVVMTESPLTTAQVDGLIDVAKTEIQDEIDDPDVSVVSDPQMKDYTVWAGYNSATLANGTDGITGGDEAILVSVPNGGGGIVSSAIACESDRYLVGAKVRVISSVGDVVPNVSMFAIENPNPVFSTIGVAAATPLTTGGGNVVTNIQIVEVDANGDPDVGGAGASVAVPIAELDGSEPLYTTFVGTYEVTTIGTYDPSSGTTVSLPSLFSLVVHADTECELSVDYVYGRLQGASVNIAQSLADSAYTDAHGFVTDMNEQLIKEQGSIISNAGMSILDANNKPAGWRTDGASGTLTLVTTGDNAIKITQESAQTGQRRLITPAFSLGTADKFSIGIRIRGINGSIDVQPKVAVTADNVLPSPYVTLAGADGGNADVLVPTDVTETSIGSAVEVTDTVNHESILVTWDKGTTTHGGLASVIIEADDDFEVDFVFVKEQTVSYDLADTQAQARRDEAIASAAGFVANIGDSLAQETGSLLTNADFTSWYKDSGSQRPQKWLVTRNASSPKRVIQATEVSAEIYAQDNTSRDAETVDDQYQSGSAIRFDPSSSGGILSAKWQLALTDEAAVTAGTATTGAYTFSVRVKVGSAAVIGVRLYAHESYTYTDASQEHVFCEDGDYGNATLEGADRTSTGTPLDSLFMFATGTDTGGVQRIGVINVSNPNDTTPGYDPNYTPDGVDNDYVEAGDDQYVEYIPLDNDGVGGYQDGDLDGTIENETLWYDIAGTYKPNAKTKCVSFEILIDGDPDGGGSPSAVYVDYASLVQQPFDSDFASTLADARVNSLTGISSESFGSSTDPTTGFTNTTLAAAILANQQRIYTVNQTLAAEDESTTLIPNSFFSDHTTNTPDLWLPTRNTDGTLTLEDDATAITNAGSYNTYVEMGGTNDVRGILSNAIPVIGDGDNTLGLTSGGLTTNPKFDLAIRYKSPKMKMFALYSTYNQGTITQTGTSSSSSSSLNRDAPLTSMYHEDTSQTMSATESALWRSGKYTILGNQYWQYNTANDITFYHGDEAWYPEEYQGFFRMSTGVSVTQDPEITFTSAATGYVRVYATSGSVVNTFTLSSTSSVDVTGLSGSTVYWFHIHMENPNNTWRITNPAGNQPFELFHITHHYDDTMAGFDPLWTWELTETVSFQIIAHEYFGSSYDDSTYKYVYANGVDYTHPTSFNAVVQRYNTGPDGQVQALNTILNNGVDTTEETEKVTTTHVWQMLVGEYEPHASAQWVSFEFVIDHDDDNDDRVPDVFVDGILLQATPDPNKSLLDQVKETAETANATAGQALSDAGDAQSDATDALSNAATNLSTINGHTTSLANIELAQSEAAIVRTGIASEQGSILFNAGFSETITSSNLAHPLGFFPFRNTPAIIRITNETSTGMELFGTVGNQSYSSEVFDSPTSIYLDVGQRGSALAVTTTNNASPYSAGFYSRATPLPKVTASITSLVDGSTSDQDSRGIYSIAVQVRSAQSTGVSVSIKALEYDDHINTDNYISETFENTYDIYGARSEWDSPSGSPATATRVIDVTGTQIDENDTTATDWEIVGSSGWTTVAGTYSPTSTAEFVSFAVYFTTDVNDEVADTSGDAPDGQTFWSTYNIGSSDRTVRALAYVDYILVTPASVSADLAADLAAGKAYEVQQDLKGDLSTLEGNLGAESDSLMPNGNFAQKFTVTAVDYVKNWLPTGQGANDKLKLWPADASSKSIGTYIKFDKDASDPSQAPYGSNISGIISKVVTNPVEIVRDTGGNINAFNIGLRIRGTTDQVESYVAGSATRSYIMAAAFEGSSLSSDHYSGIGTWSTGGNISFDIGSVSITEGDAQYLDTPIGHNVYGHEDGFIVPNKAGVELTTSGFNGKSSVLFMFGLSSLSDDNDRYLMAVPRDGSTTRTSGYSTSWWYSTDSAQTWTQRSSEDNTNPHVLEIDNDLYRNGSFDIAYMFAVLFQRDPSSETATFASDFADNIIFYINDSSGNHVFSKGFLQKVYDANAASNQTPDFGVKVIAHETYEAVADPNSIVIGDNVLIDATPHSDVGVSVTSSFGANGASRPLNLIDLRYSGSTDGDEQADDDWITIDATVVNQDAGEAITDWRHIVGSYTPNEDATGVSFEVLIDHEKDGDATVQEVWLDSITMAVSSVSSDLAATISDNRVFVEQNFHGGETPVSPLNIIKNADFSQALLVDNSLAYSGGSDDLKRPANWHYFGEENATWDWSDTKFRFSPASTVTNRGVRFYVGETTSQRYGIASSPFRITSNKYKWRVKIKSVDLTDTKSLYVFALTTKNTLSGAATVIANTSIADAGYGYYYPDDTSNHIEISGAANTFTMQVIYGVSTNHSTLDTVLEGEWEPRLQTSSLKPTSANMPEYASIIVYRKGVAGGGYLDVFEVSFEPIGQPYGTFEGGAQRFPDSTDYDNEGHVLPDVPREIEAMSPQMNSIDIEVTDSTLGSPTNDCLVVATPRKYYDANDGDQAQGTSYLYPGVSDLQYKQGEWSLGYTFNQRKIVFPNTYYNAIHNLTHLSFEACTDGSFPAGAGGSTAGGDQTIQNVGLIVFDDTFEPSGPAGTDAGLNNVGPLLYNAKNICVGNWSSSLTTDGSHTNYDGNTSPYQVALKNTLHEDGAGVRIKQTDDTGWSGLFLMPEQNDEIWVINVLYNSSATSHRMYFRRFTGPTDTGPTNEGYIDSDESGLMNFTGQHRCEDFEDSLSNAEVGLIVVSTGRYNNLIVQDRPTINESLPIVALATKRNQKSCFGVLSDKEDRNGAPREYAVGKFVSVVDDGEEMDRLIINSLGEGAIWICNINGNLENGDYITTCEIPGYGMLQDDDLLHNYTVAKITQDCNFELDNPYYDCVEFEFEGQTYRKAFVGCTYHCG